jgi:hypothetical protein
MKEYGFWAYERVGWVFIALTAFTVTHKTNPRLGNICEFQ